MSIEVAIREFTLWSEYYKTIGNVKEAVDHQQIASWLQELKERREKESRQIPEETCEALVKLTEKVIEILPDIVAIAIENMPDVIEQYIESKIRNGKEESK